MSKRTLFSPALLAAPFATSSTPKPGHELIDHKALGLILPIAGGARGTATEGDVITQTTDGRDLNEMWAELQQTLQYQNARRQLMVDFLTFPVSNVIEDVPQMGGEDFEEASEFGVPVGIRPTLQYFSLAYGFKWWDIATRFTWKFLAEASAQQVEAVHQSVLEADNRLVFREVMKALFSNINSATDISKQSYTVYRLYIADGTVPPMYRSTTFDGTHNHYLTSGAAVVDSGDVEALIEHLRHHGYSDTNGTRIVLLVSNAEATQIRRFRANVANNNAQIAVYDFVPAQGSPPFLLPANTGAASGLLGTQPAANLAGFTVIGQYGPALIVEEDNVPAGYMAIIGTGGEGSLNNPVGFREHANANLRGLRLIPGARDNYPLTNSFYNRGFGTGIRQRGGAAIMQITAAATYTIPTAYAG